MSNGVFWISYGFLWSIALVLAILMLLIYRQVGLVYLGSRRAIEHGGIAKGASVPDIELTPFANGQAQARLSGVLATRGGPTLVLFSLPMCQLCQGIAADFQALLGSWSQRVNFVWIERSGLEKIPNRFGDTAPVDVFVADEKAYAAFDIRAAPYVYLISEHGAVLERGLVNKAEDIRLLLVERVGASESAIPPRQRAAAISGP